MRRPPAATCAGCDKPLSERGGVRIRALKFAGVSIFHDNQAAALRDLQHPARTFRLEDSLRQLVVVFWGDTWEPAWIERGLEAARARLHPWLCQRCAQYAMCERCGAPLVWAPGASTIADDGRDGPYLPLFATPPCTNPDCPDWFAPSPSPGG